MSPLDLADPPRQATRAPDATTSAESIDNGKRRLGACGRGGRLYGLRFPGPTQRKLDASFGSPPTKCGYLGYSQSGRVNNRLPAASTFAAGKVAGAASLSTHALNAEIMSNRSAPGPPKQ